MQDFFNQLRTLGKVGKLIHKIGLNLDDMKDLGEQFKANKF